MTTVHKPEAAIVDVDGTLVDVSGIRHYVTAGHKTRNFDDFHKASAVCPAIPDSLSWVEGQRARGRKIIIVTARQRQYEHLTRVWLRKWGIHFDELHMRDTGDPRPDSDVKRDILAQIRERYDVREAIDDNPSVIALWRSEGIPVTVVPGWPEDA